MHFNDWMDSATDEEKNRLAESAITSPAYLYLMQRGHKPISPKMAAKLEKATTELTPDRIIDARKSVTINAAA